MTSGEGLTWWQHLDGDGRQHLLSARCGDTLKDVTRGSLFHFVCEIDTGQNDGTRFKGHYLDNPLLVVERHPRHLRHLTHEEKIHVPLSLTHRCSTPPRVDGECAGCVRRMNENPSAGSGTPARDSNPGVSRPQQLERIQHYLGSNSPKQLGAVQQFALQSNNTLVHLKRVAKSLGLRVTTAGRGVFARNLPICTRITFGLKTRAVRVLTSRNIRVTANLFKFGFHVLTGFYEPSTSSARTSIRTTRDTRHPHRLSHDIDVIRVPPFLFRVVGENNAVNLRLYSQYRRVLLEVCSGSSELGISS